MTDQLLQLIISQAWQIAALASIVAIVNRTVAKNRPHLAHALWMLVLIKCVTPPIWGHSLGLFSQLQAVAFEKAPAISENGETALIELSHEPGFQRPFDGSESVDFLATDSRGPESERTFESTIVADARDSGGIDVQASSNSSAALDDGHELDSAAWASSAEPAPIPWSQIVLATVLLGALATFGLMIVRCVRCLRLIHRHRTTEFDAMLDERLRLLAKQLRMRRIPTIVVSDVLFGPAVLGLLRHTIVLPRCLLQTSSSSLPGRTVLGRSFLPERTFAEGEPARRALDNTGLPDGTECTQVAASREVLPGRQDLQEPLPGRQDLQEPLPGRQDLPRPLPGRQDLQFLDPILAHELLHIRRGDLRTGTLQAIVQSLWWFHPAVWLCNRWLSREAERCCDEQVIAELGCSPAQYARSLLSVIESKHALQPIPVFPGMKPVEITTQRMERIMSLKTGLKKQTPLWCWLAVAVLAIVVLPGAVAKPATDEQVSIAENESELLGEAANNIESVNIATEPGADRNPADVAGEAIATEAPESVSKPLRTKIRLDDNLVLSRKISIMENAVIVYVNEQPVTVKSLLEGTSTGILLKHIPEMNELDRRRMVADEIEKSLSQYVFQEIIFQHFDGILSPEEEEQLAKAEAKRNAELFKMLPEMLAKSKRLENQQQLLSDALIAYAITHEGDGGILSILSRQTRVSRLIGDPPSPSFLSKQEAVRTLCDELILEAQLRKDVSLNFDDRDLVDVLRSIATDYGVNIALKPRAIVTADRDMAGSELKVTYQCENQPLDEALAALLEPIGLCVCLNGSTVMIGLIDEHSAANPADNETPSNANHTRNMIDTQLSFEGNTFWGEADLAKQLSKKRQAGVFGDSLTQSELVSELELIKQLYHSVGFFDAEVGDVADPAEVSVEDNRHFKIKEGQRYVVKETRYEGNTSIATNEFLNGSEVKVGDHFNSYSVSKEVKRIHGLYQQLKLESVRVDPVPCFSETPGEVVVVFQIDEKNDVAMPSPVSEPLVKLDNGRSGGLVTPNRPVPTAIGEASDPLLKLVWETRESIRKRLLSAETHTPWQIMSAIEGLRRDMLLKDGDKTVNALEWIQAGPQYQGEPWFEKTEHGGRAHPYSKPYWFEGHVNQFLSKLAAGRLPLETQFQTSDGPITIQNMIDHAKMVVNDKEEVSWTLLALCRYLPPDDKWTNAKGEEWSIERLVEIEVSRRVGGSKSPDGGTSGLYALAVARNECLKTGKPLEGVWLKADEKIRKYIGIAKSQQNTDGTLSSDFFRSSQRKEDFDKRLASSGHLLQFLMHAVSDEQLQEDWIRRAVEATASDLQVNRKEYVSADPLFTATAALTTYLERVTGEVSAAVRDGVPNQLHQPDAALEATERQKQNLVILYGVADLVTPVAKTAADPVNATNAVAAGTLPEPPQAAEVTRRKNQLVVRKYKVADLVVRGSMGLNTLEPSTTLPNKVDEGVSKHVPETEPEHAFGPRVLTVSFQPLTELIKTTIQPESWNDKEGVIDAGIFVENNEPGEFLLSVRQTAAVHEEIEDLLSALRADLNQIVVISCRVMKIATNSQIKGLEERSSLHTLGDGQRWALLTKTRIDELQKFLTDENAEVLACPKIVTPSGQAALVEVGAEAQSAFQGFRLSANPHLIADSSVIRLSHSVSIGEIASDPSPAQTESLMSSGQTLLLLVEAPQKETADEESVAASTGRFVILLTAEKLEEQEETVK